MIENDLKIITKCSHEVINLPIKFQRTTNYYFASLYFTSTGPGQLLTSETMYQGPNCPSVTNFSYNEDRNKIVIPVANFTPDPNINYYFSSRASVDTCPICGNSLIKSSNNPTNIFDLQLNTTSDYVDGITGNRVVKSSFNFVNKVDLAYQRYYKFLLTYPGSNAFDSTYGTGFTDLIGANMDSVFYALFSQAIILPINWYTRNAQDFDPRSYVIAIKDIKYDLSVANRLKLILKVLISDSTEVQLELEGETINEI